MPLFHSRARVRTRRRSRSGFSLIELLVTIVVIAVITAIALVYLSGVKNSAAENSAIRNAQIVASAVANAQIAGDQSIAAAASKEQAIDLISNGVHGDGVFSHVQYRVQLSPKEKATIAQYLVFGDGLLLFNAAGGG